MGLYGKPHGMDLAKLDPIRTEKHRVEKLSYPMGLCIILMQQLCIKTELVYVYEFVVFLDFLHKSVCFGLFFPFKNFPSLSTGYKLQTFLWFGLFEFF